MNILNLTAAQLRRAADIKDTIALLQKALEAVINGMPEPNEWPSPVLKHTPKPFLKRRAMSAAAKRKISLAAKFRWRQARKPGQQSHQE